MTLVARSESEYDALVTVRNDGACDARDVEVFVDAPRGMSIVGASHERFERIAAGASAEHRVTLCVAGPIDGAAVTLGGVRVACAGVPQFFLAPATCPAVAGSPFADARLSVDGPADVHAGERLVVRLHARNGASVALAGVTIRLELPDALSYAPGSIRLHGVPLVNGPGTRKRGRRAPDAKRRVAKTIAPLTFERLSAGEAFELEAHAYAVPRRVEEDALVRAELTWPGGAHALELPLLVRGAAQFPAPWNRVEIDGPQELRAGEPVRLKAFVHNAGSAAADDVGLVWECATAGLLPAGSAALGTLDAGDGRTVELAFCAPAEADDGAFVTVGATLTSGDRPLATLLPARIAVRSLVRFSTDGCALEHDATQPLRPGGSAVLRVRVTNEGSRPARRVRAVLELPEHLACDDDTVALGDVAPRQTACAEVRLRLAMPVSGALRVAAVLRSESAPDVELAPIWIDAQAQARFEATLAGEPAERIEVGEPVTYFLDIVNAGDGIAGRVSVHAPAPEGATYVAGSTRINDRQVVDRGGEGALHGPDGLAFEDVAPGVRLCLTWSLHTHRATDALTVAARICWDGNTVTASAPPLAVEPPRDADGDGGLPFRIAALVRPVCRAAQRVEPAVESEPVWLLLDAGAARREEMLAFLHEVDCGALVTHVLSLRPLVADRVASADGADAALRSYRALWRETVDRLYIKLRMPSYRVALRDLEDARSRRKLTELLSELRECAPVSHAADPPALRRRVATAEVDEVLRRLEGGVLGGPQTVEAVAQLVPDESLESPRLGAALTRYLDAIGEVFRSCRHDDRDAFARLLGGPAPAPLDAARAELLGALAAGA